MGDDPGETEVAVALRVACLPLTELGSDSASDVSAGPSGLDHSHGERWSVSSDGWL